MKKNSGNSKKCRFVIIGAGNVGTHLTRELYRKGFQPVKIINRSPDKAKKLAKETNCDHFSADVNIDTQPDFILIAVNDDSLPEIVKKISPGNVPVIHCSGSTPISVFPVDFFHYGVLYPLQTLSTGRTPVFEKIPFLLEASDDETIDLLKYIASSLSDVVLEMNSKDRLKYHIAAVFASNFTYHMLSLASDYLKKNKLPDDILEPLIQETIFKFFERGGQDGQTGPAVREDMKILKKHKEMLKNDPDFQKIYTFVSKSIIQYKMIKE